MKRNCNAYVAHMSRQKGFAEICYTSEKGECRYLYVQDIVYISNSLY